MKSVIEPKLEQVIYESDQTIVYRGIDDNAGPVIIKAAKGIPSLHEIARYKNEWEIIHKLSSPYVIKGIDFKATRDSIQLVLEDIEGVSVKEFLHNHDLKLVDRLNMMISITEALSYIHSQNIIYKDMNPSNIIYEPTTNKIQIIDFGISTEMIRENQMAINPNLLEGTLAYISPEQTGRMNRAIDYKTDIYSLGVTFYEILTGHLPFKTRDTMELIHSHLAKQPPQSYFLDKEIPMVLSNIVLKCMAKNAEDRYSSCIGIIEDLKVCVKGIVEAGKVEEFPLGEKDISDQFQIVQKLYGREREVQELIKAFNRVSNGNKELIHVSGFSGIGKSVLVNEIHKPIVREKGYFISGKFDQYKRNKPYSSLIQAFQELIKYILTESEEKIELWKRKINNVLYPNGQIMIDVIPELELIIGSQPAVKELGQMEAYQRFNIVFQNFLSVFTKEDHPLVIFLDDMQWVDSASIQLIQLFMSKPDITYLLLICSYRDNEVSKAHPFMQMLEDLEKNKVRMDQISLLPLEKQHVQDLISDSFHFEREELDEVIDFVYSKTNGNPFFTNQLLTFLYREQVINFDLLSRRWRWNQNEILNVTFSENIVDLMLHKIKALDSDAQRTLMLAAVIGNQFDLKTLAIVAESKQSIIANHLWKALQEGLIIPNDHHYKMIHEMSDDFVAFNDIKVEFKFFHDRIQQAAYSLISEDQKPALHYHIGRMLIEKINGADVEEYIFEIVNHLNIGQALMSGKEEVELAEMNIKAGIKAKSSMAYDTAIKYFEVGLSLLPENHWEEYYDLSSSVYKELCECKFLTNELEGAEKYFDIFLQNVKTNVEKAEAYYIKTMIYQNQYKYIEAVDACVEGLRLTGIHIPHKPNAILVGLELLKTTLLYSRVNIEDLLDLPENKDRKIKIASMLAVSLANNAYFTDVNKAFLGVLKINQYSLKYGNTSASAFSYLSYAVAISSVFGDYKNGFRLAKAALEVSEKFEDPLISRNYFTFATAVNHWNVHIKNNQEFTRKGFQSSIETGDIIYTAYNATLQVEEMLYYGENLEVADKELKKYQHYLQMTLNKNNEEMFHLFENYIQTLFGKLSSQKSIIGELFDEKQYLEAFGPPTNLFRYYIARMELLLLFGKDKEALDTAEKAYPLKGSSVGQLRGALYFFYYGLTLAANYQSFSVSKKAKSIWMMKSIQRKFRKWSKNCPENFLHQYYLLSAEIARVRNNSRHAFKLYDLAIQAAEQNGYLHHKARTNELAGRLALKLKKENWAKIYLNDAYKGYQTWGATAKVKEMLKQFEDIIAYELKPVVIESDHWNQISHLTTLRTVTATEQKNILDLSTIVKASQTISNEIKLDRLLHHLMRIVMENAGAGKGLLLLKEKHHWLIEAESMIDEQEIKVLDSTPVEKSNKLSLSIFQYVSRTKESVVIHNGIEEHQFASDPYMEEMKPKSILCMPILNQNQLTAILYLENNLSTHVFTNDRIEVLNMLSSQAAISINNARLYANLDEAVKIRTQELESTLETLKMTQKQLVESEKFSSLGNLVAGIAHEINTPVGISVTAVTHLEDKTNEFIQLFNENRMKKSSLIQYLNQVQESTKMIDSNLHRASDLIRSFKQVAVDQSTDLNRDLMVKDYLDELLLSLQPNVRKTKIDIEVDCSNDLKINSNPGVLSQIITNLVMNSLIHAYEKDSQGKITLAGKLVDNQFILDYSDDGCGMTEDVKKNIFEPFFTTNRGSGGTGLGMHIVYNLVTQSLAGTISCESSPGKGTCFEIVIPVSQ